MQPLQTYIRTQGVVCAAINAVVNPALAWVANRGVTTVPLAGGGSIVIDTAITCVVMALLVALCVTPAVRRELRAGRITSDEARDWRGGWLARLPMKAWALGLVLGISAACVLAPLIFVIFRALGVSGMSVGGFALLKALYTAPLGYAITRWVILRQVQATQ